MSRGFDSFDLDDFRYFLPDSSRGKSPRREYPEEREPKRGADGDTNSKPRELPTNSAAGDLRDMTRNVYRHREHAYSLRNSEIHTLIETGKFRVVDTEDLFKFAYAGNRDRMKSELRNLTEQGLIEERNTSILKKESRQVLTLRIAETVYDGHFDTPKTQRSARVIPASEEVRRILGNLQQPDSQPEQLVFKTASGTPLNRHNLLRRHLRPACQKLGLVGIGWHSLRHAHATLLDAAGAPLGTVQALLGHSSPEITREIYIHAIPDDQRQAVQRVEALVFGPKWTQVPESPKTNAA